jgi:hypothetical protein
MLKKLLFLLVVSLCLCAQVVFATPLNEVDTVHNWTGVTQNLIVVSPVKDVSANYQNLLIIDSCLSSATATTNGLQITVQGSSSATDNNWFDITTYRANSGITATKKLIYAGTDVGSTLLGLGTGTITGLVTGTKVYVKDATIANSEMRVIMSFATGSTGPNVDSGMTYGHALVTPLYSGTGAGVGAAQTTAVAIPDTTTRLRIIYDNTLDATGADVDVRANINKKSGI